MLCPEISCLFLHFWSSHIFLCCRCSNIYHCNPEYFVSFKGFFPETVKFVMFVFNATLLHLIRQGFVWVWVFLGEGWGVVGQCGRMIPNACSTPLKRITPYSGGIGIWIWMTHFWQNSIRALMRTASGCCSAGQRHRQHTFQVAKCRMLCYEDQDPRLTVVIRCLSGNEG